MAATRDERTGEIYQPRSGRHDDAGHAPPQGLADRAGGSALLQRKIARRAIQRRAAGSETPAAATAMTTAKTGAGAPLDASVRSGMETSFGASFADVRVHEGAAAESMGAVAFAQGNDLHFAPGQYSPSSSGGRELIGHELAHVVQQRAGRVDVPQGKEASAINSDAALEAEADAAGAAAARGEVAHVAGTASPASVQRKVSGSSASLGRQGGQASGKAKLAKSTWARLLEQLKQYEARESKVERGKKDISTLLPIMERLLNLIGQFVSTHQGERPKDVQRVALLKELRSKLKRELRSLRRGEIRKDDQPRSASSDREERATLDKPRGGSHKHRRRHERKAQGEAQGGAQQQPDLGVVRALESLPLDDDYDSSPSSDGDDFELAHHGGEKPGAPPQPGSIHVSTGHVDGDGRASPQQSAHEIPEAPSGGGHEESSSGDETVGEDMSRYLTADQEDDSETDYEFDEKDRAAAIEKLRAACTTTGTIKLLEQKLASKNLNSDNDVAELMSSLKKEEKSQYEQRDRRVEQLTKERRKEKKEALQQQSAPTPSTGPNQAANYTVDNGYGTDDGGQSNLTSGSGSYSLAECDYGSSGAHSPSQGHAQGGEQSSNYSDASDPYAENQSSPAPARQPLGPPKPKVMLTPEEITRIEREVDLEFGIVSRPDVQKGFFGEGQPEEVQSLQTGLRANAKSGLVEKDPNNKKTQRTALTHNEKNSTGWALLPMIEEYLAVDRGHNGPKTKFATRYLFDEDDDLVERKMERQGFEQTKERSETVLSFQDGVWRTASDKTADTSGARQIAMAVNERKDKLNAKRARLTEEMQQQHIPPDKVKEIEARLDQLAEKLKNPSLSAHHSVRGKHIFVMNAAGQLFAAESEQWVLHHSSFLAGGAVAAAGEVGIDDGKLVSISNQSGHYKPGPAYLWQAVKQLQLLGCPLDQVAVTVMGVRSRFRNAHAFLDAMDPSSDSQWFDVAWATAQLDQADKGRKQQPGGEG